MKRWERAMYVEGAWIVGSMIISTTPRNGGNFCATVRQAVRREILKALGHSFPTTRDPALRRKFTAAGGKNFHARSVQRRSQLNVLLLSVSLGRRLAEKLLAWNAMDQHRLDGSRSARKRIPRYIRHRPPAAVEHFDARRRFSACETNTGDLEILLRD